MSRQSLVDDDLVSLRDAVLHHAPVDALSPELIQSLQHPTLIKMRGAAEALLSGGYLDSAEMLFEALSKRPGHESWAAVGFARVTSKRGDARASVAAWRHCLHQFPDDAKPHWFVELARAERADDRTADAEATLRRCLVGFPDFSAAAVALAELLTGAGRLDLAEAAWRAALERFFDEARPWWYAALASILGKTDQTEQERQIVDGLARRFPDAHLTLVSQARLAGRLENWGHALTLWNACRELHADKIQLEWLLGRAMALFRQLQPEAALHAWQEVIDRFSHLPAGYAAKAMALQELGRWHEAEQTLTDLIARFPDQLTPQRLAALARCFMNQRREDAADRVILQLKHEFPQSSLHAGLALERAMRVNQGLDTLVPLITNGVDHFPEDRDLMCRFARILMAAGRFAEAEAVVARLEATGGDHLARIARWRMILDRDGDPALRDAVESALIGGASTPEQAMAFYDFLLGVWSIWAVDLTLVLLDQAIERFPGRIALHAARASTLIALNENSRALEAIDAIPALYQTREVLQLRAWMAAQRDELEMARQYWRVTLSTNYHPSLHGAEPRLERLSLEEDFPATEGVTVFLPVRNELARLTEFMNHHRRLGVRGFVVVDNMSTDGCFEYLLEQTDVILYRTADHFQAAGNGMRWINWLIQRHGGGGWCLFADADEAFIYPGWEKLPLIRLCAYLDQEGAEGMAGFMLDLYPERLWDGAGQPAKHVEHCYYDSNYTWRGQVKPPYHQPVGGARSRLFGAEEYLHKVPLIKSSRGVHIGNHETTPLRLADVTGVLLHYKMLTLAEKRSNPRLRTNGNPFMADVNPDMMRRYQRYDRHLERLAGTDLRVQGVTRKLAGSMAIADQGLMQAPARFRQWLSENEMLNA